MSSTIDSSFALVNFFTRCFGPPASAVMNGRLISVSMVVESSIFARSAAANADDLRLIKSCTDLAVECALRRESGVIGHDEDRGGVLRAIEFPRIKGGKPFDSGTPWFGELLQAIGQPRGAAVAVKH